MMRHLGRDTRIAEVVRGERAAGRQVEVVPAGADKTESLRLFAEVLGFPSYFGHNLDALADSLTDHVGTRAGEWSLIWDGARGLRASDEATYAAIDDILGDLANDSGVHVTVIDR
ncbi:barstar family protein [Nostocoides jenkinsii]|uniref:Barstar (barnase inhibitor) domain-containing protein n=1 Tax=Nostocoides jenkinsii Ben 74 TaxID=1193518 RepID=A0A077MCC5_9MICO|nr:barstar family protein [Tetrasphaera jenkinsii]CCI52507.1 conserved hypothetical protein [Tetrasphaera jenkinsii Ben 74]